MTFNITVPYVPTPFGVIRKMLEIANLKENETLMDLGCGDGRVLVIAAKEFKAYAIGVELRKDLVDKAINNIKKNNVVERTFIINTPKLINQKVKLAGWVNSLRVHKDLIFIDLRDFSGIVQVVVDLKEKNNLEIAKSLNSEDVISVIGLVKKRPEKMINKKIKTGTIEIIAEKIDIYSKAKTLPFSIKSSGYEISEEKRLKYRYLDLRRERLKNNLKTRNEVISFFRDYLRKENFVEIETPILTKSTPEGARDFVVPSRIYPGKFYALPQSPQQYKQLLQVAGFERYFQIARCLRDEDPRSDRQAEHTQLDIEMSFVSENDILNLIEEIFKNLINKLFPEKKISKVPFPRIPYKKAINEYKIFYFLIIYFNCSL